VRPTCPDCRNLPVFLPDYPERWPYYAEPEPDWLRWFLAPRLLTDPEPVLLKPAPPIELDPHCRDCGAAIPYRPGPGTQKQRGL
jgi:hypothetical protein